MGERLSYDRHVDYETADPAKVLAQREGQSTSSNLPYGYSEVAGTRGESAYVFDMGGLYGALVQEGLGTKSLVARDVYDLTGRSHFPAIAHDTVAAIINDLVSVGARPVALNAYWSASSYEWLADAGLSDGFIKGWRSACDLSKVTWGGGETQSLPGVVVPGALEFAGCAFGVIRDKKDLVQAKALRPKDAIVLVASNGVHANGISLVREIAAQLEAGYLTKLADGSELGTTVLRPSHIYADLVASLLGSEVQVHYLSHITGHGWRKLMRAAEELSYVVTDVPPVPEVFNFIAAEARLDLKEMYGTFNMGAGYAVYVPESQAEEVATLAAQCGLQSWVAGRTEAGPRRVVVEPLGIVFEGDTLGVR
ncbi:MAG: AIR synthase-related protein [Acidimicrobiales bacterium]|jgi:phosphoribosylformylglycinamidine cyclo-ligase